MSKRLSGWENIRLLYCGCDENRSFPHGNRREGNASFHLEQRIRVILLATVAILLLGGCRPAPPEPGLQDDGLQLVYIERFDIENKAEGLREPSGLMLANDRAALWTVSDDKKRIFKLTLQGQLDTANSFAISDKGLEGIALDPSGAFLLTVQEENNQVIVVDAGTQKVTQKQRLSDMQGYSQVDQHFANGDKNKGLEGITWNSDSSTIFVLKEGEPGLLLELSTDLSTILNQKLLTAGNGFQDNDVGGDELDFSGIFYDSTRMKFWIVSDKGQRLFLYDWNADRVLQSVALAYSQNGKQREIEKAEGVTLDPSTGRLYVVSDAEARLYVFEVRE